MILLARARADARTGQRAPAAIGGGAARAHGRAAAAGLRVRLETIKQQTEQAASRAAVRVCDPRRWRV